MKRTFLIILLLIIILQGTVSALEPQDLKDFPTCEYCAMNRAQYAHSRVLVEYEDGTRFGACSIHCAAVNIAMNLNKSPKSIRVGDYYSTELIDAESAYWVIGGMKTGVMTKRGKWAFQRKRDAEKFISENGGEMATFEQALNAAYEDMYMDLKMIRGKRKVRGMQE
jgi:copper chaperone NosL